MKLNKIFIFLLVLLNLLSISYAQTEYVEFVSGTANGVWDSWGQYVSQGITTGNSDFVISQIDFQLTRLAGATGTIQVDLYTSNVGKTGTLIGNLGNISISSLIESLAGNVIGAGTNTSNVWVSLNTSPYTLLANTQYVVLLNDGNIAQNWLAYASYVTPLYSGGDNFYGASIPPTTYNQQDMYFRIWGNPPSLTPTINHNTQQYYNTSTININLNTSTNTNMSYSLDSGLENSICNNCNTTTLNLNSLNESLHNIIFISIDNNGQVNTSVNFTIDFTKPNITILSGVVNDFLVNFTTILNVTDLNLDTCTVAMTYLENVTNASQYDQLINCTDTTTFGAAGLYNGFVTATDLAGNVNTLSANETIRPYIYFNFFDINGISISNYSSYVYHENNLISSLINTNNPINISPIHEGSLHLGNHTIQFSKVGYQIINTTIDINETSGGTTYNITIPFSKININVYDRDSLNLISQNVNLELLNNGGVNLYGATFNTSTGQSTYINSSFISGNYILRSTSSGYNAVEYYFSYSGQENATINLYMVSANKTDGSGSPVLVDVKIVVQDSAGFDVGAGYILKILQQYSSQNGATFIVDSGKTNANGEVLFNLEYNSIFYSVLIEKDGTTLNRIDTFKITKFGSNCNLGECYYFSIGGAIASGDNYATADNIDFNLRYVNVTNTTGYIQFSFNNLDGLTSNYCLDTYQKIYFDYTKINTTCLNAASGVISYNLNGTDVTSFKGVGYVVGDFGVLGSIYIDDTNLSLEWGIYGLVGTIILLFVVIGIGSYAASRQVQDAPALTLALIVGIMWATDSLQMVKWGYVILFTITLIVGVIIWLLYRKK